MNSRKRWSTPLSIFGGMADKRRRRFRTSSSSSGFAGTRTCATGTAYLQVNAANSNHDVGTRQFRLGWHTRVHYSICDSGRDKTVQESSIEAGRWTRFPAPSSPAFTANNMRTAFITSSRVAPSIGMHDGFWHTNQQRLYQQPTQSSHVEILFREPTRPFTMIGPVSSFGAPLAAENAMYRAIQKEAARARSGCQL